MSVGDSARPTTVIDLWKCAALLLITIDHVGFYWLADQPWLMAIGRASLPIFFFLIGFARSRAVPWTWWAGGALLTALDYARTGAVADITVNILINFALIRLALPSIERHVIGSAWRTALFAVGLAAIALPVNQIIDYGSTGWLLALVGLAHRRALESGPDRARDPAWLTRRALGAFATLAFVAVEIDGYGFGVSEAWITAGCVILTSGLLLRFRPGEARWQPGGGAARLLAYGGRRSLEIYIAQMLVFVGVNMALGLDAADADAEDEE